MASIDFTSKICKQRPYDKSHSRGSLHSAVESDRGRIINSAAIRRLQQKTQVFPLERNAAVRSRLTHSLEVQQAGRFICQKIIDKLKDSGQPDFGLVALERSVESLVEMACLMHDIGNPPFGHFGEKAIGDWFKAFLNAHAPQDFPQEGRRDLEHFEGNAQAIRLVSSLLNLNLTYTQAACILKYTRPAWEPKPDKSDAFSYLKKKPGFYLTEQSYVLKLQERLSMEEGCRHPLSYIMEAADDISYCYADIEDAVEKKILNVEQLYDLLLEQFQALGGNVDEAVFQPFSEPLSFKDLLNQALKRYDSESIDKNNKFFVNLRVSLNHILTNHAVERFVDNIEAVYHGTFNQALLEDDSPAHKLSEAFQRVALQKVFSHKEVELQELRGYKILQGLLDYYRPLMALDAEVFQGLLNNQWSVVKDHALEARMANKLPGKHCRAYLEGLKAHPDDSNWEFYCRCRLMQDFVSGMTDQFALEQYQSLMVVD